VTTISRHAGQFSGQVAHNLKRIPGATYRLQFNREFTFQQARGILDYLRELGVSDVYASPLFQAGPQSTHGYDTCCFSKINPNIGSIEDFERYTTDLKERGLGLLLDLVPNHMSATLSNPWWLDVLENGRHSPYADFFDIDWNSRNPALRHKVLLPVLEDDYGKVLEAGKLRLVCENGKYFIAYYDRKFPVNSESLAACGTKNSKLHLNELNGSAGDAHSFDRLDALIQRQHYQLACWKVAAEEINYRRFFDVTEMVALKMESPEVFRETHRLVFEWLASRQITGLRIDHPDGLWDPREYLERLQKDRSLYVIVEKILCGSEQLPRDWPADGTTGYDFLNRVNGLFVDEKNASAFDEIYRDFTGTNTSFAEIVYRSRKQVLECSFASELNSLAHRLEELVASARCGRDLTFSELHSALEEIIANFPVYRTYITENSKAVSEPDRAVIQEGVKAARERAGTGVESVAFDFIENLLLLENRGDFNELEIKRTREFVMKFQQLTGPAMAKGLEDTAFYRFNRLISLNEVGGEPGKFGVSVVEFHEANATTAKSWPHTLLASATHDTKRGEDVRVRLNVLSEMPVEWRDAVTRWEQMNRSNKTVAQSGAAPSANDEYLFYQTLVGAWTQSLNNQDSLTAFRDRLNAFMLKAVKEAKVNTNWTEPNADYENALRKFIGQTLSSGNRFLDDAERFAQRVAFFGRFNSLSQTLLKITSPGVPDFYQGTELWDLNLVDPDNRRPVDYERRKKLIADLKSGFESVADAGGNFFGALLQDEKPGAIKLFLIWRALNFRATRIELFDSGEYLPLSAVGDHAQHICAFARDWKEQEVVVIVPRLVFGLTRGAEVPPIGGEIWKETFLPVPPSRPGDLFRNVLTREMVPVIEREGVGAMKLSQALKSFPVALLEKI